MAGKSKGTAGDHAMSFRLSRTLYDRLVEAAAGRSVSEEMRVRLEASFDAPSDEHTRKLLTAIAAICRIGGEGGWHQRSRAHEIAKQAIGLVLDAMGHAPDPQQASSDLVEFARVSAVVGLMAVDTDLAFKFASEQVLPPMMASLTPEARAEVQRLAKEQVRKMTEEQKP